MTILEAPSKNTVGSNRTATEESRPSKAQRRRKIMVVDDDPLLREALNIRLRAQTYEVVNAGDGYSALALAQKEQPDLILLDLGLPACDGMTVLKYLRQFRGLESIPVVVLSARDPQTNETPSLDAGAVAFFQKPADNDELMGVIKVCLQAGRTFGRLPC
ncbi:MAG TPA: response regulator [Terriglobales bacterium]|nr:response regulator [Terriglobales bacterium]